MERYVVAECKPGATLAVMGSVKVTSNVFDSVVVGLPYVHLPRHLAFLGWFQLPICVHLNTTGLRYPQLPAPGRWIAPHRSDPKLHQLPGE